MTVKICVVGAGVIGLSTAVQLTELRMRSKAMRVTVVAESFSPHTTSDGAGGLWEPHLCADTPAEKIKKWGDITFDHMVALAKSSDARETGSIFMSGSTLFPQKPKSLPPWKDTVYSFSEMTAHDILPYSSVDTRLQHGYSHTSVGLDGTRYLPWLMNKFLNNGGTVRKRKVHSLDELAGDFDIVVNCTGLGSYELERDLNMTPIRGQVIQVEAPWIRHFTILDINDAELIYIIPKASCVTLGGTHEYGKWSTAPDPTERDRILNMCCKLEPSLKKARILRDWVGLRPSRSEIRLETEIRRVGSKVLKIVHNYGHGGAGVTLHWGCAQHACALVQQLLSPAQL